MTLWRITGHTESADHFAYLIEAPKKPTADQIDTLLCRDMSIEYEEVGFTNWTCRKINIDQLPTRADVRAFKADMRRWHA